MNIQNPVEHKLLELYRKHDYIAYELINLLELTKTEIGEGSGNKLELYSTLESEIISKLTAVVRVIEGYELIDGSVSAGFYRCSMESLKLRRSIQILHNRNIDLLKYSLDKTLKMIDSFSMNTKYKLPSLNEPSPRFVDFSV
ncbi:MAG: hypothetical protein L3J12_09240 [Spirochaetales bacterium]|nr:hypothetical protein [Spirochaetales bacterium]